MRNVFLIRPRLWFAFAVIWLICASQYMFDVKWAPKYLYVHALNRCIKESSWTLVLRLLLKFGTFYTILLEFWIVSNFKILERILKLDTIVNSHYFSIYHRVSGVQTDRGIHSGRLVVYIEKKQQWTQHASLWHSRFYFLVWKTFLVITYASWVVEGKIWNPFHCRWLYSKSAQLKHKSMIGTLSKAFWKSIKIARVSILQWKLLCMSVINSKSWEWRERDSWKPCWLTKRRFFADKWSIIFENKKCSVSMLGMLIREICR